MINPHIKILILNWNGIGVIENCLSSISNIKYENYSVCMIDNNSDDESLAYVKNTFNFVEIVDLDKNYGYSKGYNLGIDKLLNNESDFYLILNNDTIITDYNILNILVQSSIKYGVENIYSPIITDPKNKIWYAGGIVNKIFGYTRHIDINKSLKYGKYKTLKTDYVSGCCMFIDKNLFNNLNGFNESYKMYYEDVDLCLRAKKNNSDCYMIGSTHIVHNFSSSFNGLFKFKKMYIKFISMIKFIFNNNYFVISILVLFFHVFLLPIYFILFFIKILLRK